jgi:hypothetical protein
MVLTASVAFHDQSVKPGSPLLVSVSLLSHLPSPVVIEQMEIQFNQSDCNFVIHSTQEDCTSLTLFTNKWMRLTREVKSSTLISVCMLHFIKLYIYLQFSIYHYLLLSGCLSHYVNLQWMK